MYGQVQQTSLAGLPRPAGLLRGIDRWFVPGRFTGWGDASPDRYVLSLPFAPAVLLTCSPEDCRAIFTEREGRLRFGEGLRRLAPHEAMFGHDAIASLDGDEHTRLRRQLTAAFHGDALRGYEAAIVAATRQQMATWPLGRPIPFADHLHDLARDVIAATVIGVTEPARGRRLAAVLDRLDAEINSTALGARFAAAILLRGRWLPYPAMDAIHAELAQITREEITARRRRSAANRTGCPESGGPDCLARLLTATADDDADDPGEAGGAHPGSGMTDDEIVAATRVLVVAGWATSATTLAWTAERLARHPAALAGCARDARDGGRRYLTATVQETLRMRPPVPVTVRYAAADVAIGELRIPQGTLVAADIERMHHRSDIYSAPHAFRPERFLDERPGTYTWIPFGGGVHRCIGAGFALTEARLILATILSELTFAEDRGAGERLRRRTLVTTPQRRAVVTLLPARA